MLRLDQVLILAKAFYEGRFGADFEPVTPERVTEAFAEAGLSGDHWQV